MRAIAIIGATGHMGQALAAHYAATPDVQLSLFSRRPETTRATFAGHPDLPAITHAPIDSLGEQAFDLVINAVGIGNPAMARIAGPDFYKATMRLEDLIDRAVADDSGCLTVFMSSGAVFGGFDAGPADAGTPALLQINAMTAGDWYGATKLAVELRHRAQTNRRILDLRAFGFVSRFIDLDTTYLICDIVKAIRADRPMLTGAQDIARDFIGTRELAALIDVAMAHPALNVALDTYSLAPVRKFALFERLAPQGLKWAVEAGRDDPGGRINYWSRNHRAAALGYRPSRMAVDVVAQVVAELMERR
jgi:nucleoside-diphosphate-sugar epimerase